MSPLDLPLEQLDEAFALTAAYNADPSLTKVSLGAGVYRDESGEPWILPSVREAKDILHGQKNLNHEYLPIHGSDGFLKVASNLIFGDSNESPTVRSVQTISGTGANHLAALFLAHNLKPTSVFIPDPTWINHHTLWEIAAPGVLRKTYPYYSSSANALDFAGMMAALEKAEENDVVILQACAHNPTGLDPSKAQWADLAQLMTRKKLFAVFDSAYQGFATGDPDADAWAVRYFRSVLFASADTPAGMMVAQSFAKNFGLYGERVGALHLVLPPGVPSDGAFGKLLRLIRAEMSNCPRFGARIVETVLNSLKLTESWHQDLKTMSGRIKSMRKELRLRLEALGSDRDWEFVEDQIGMFSFTGLNEEQVLQLRREYSVYLMISGRASLSGLNQGNVNYVAKAIHEVTR